jgi:hypothetical protein
LPQRQALTVLPALATLPVASIGAMAISYKFSFASPCSSIRMIPSFVVLTVFT